MIELKIEGYCQECRAFEPEVKQTDIRDDDYFIVGTHSTVVCINAKKCEGIARYLKRHLLKDSEEDLK